MIRRIATRIDCYPGDQNRVRCFGHVINLVGKSMLKLFDVPKMAHGAEFSEAEKELLDVAAGLDLDDHRLQMEDCRSGIDEDGDDVEEAAVAELASMGDDERRQLEGDIMPIRLVLAKVLLSQ